MEAFQHEQHNYNTAHSNLISSTHTGIAVAIMFSLCANAEQLNTAKASLENLVKTTDSNISTGLEPVGIHVLSLVCHS